MWTKTNENKELELLLDSKLDKYEVEKFLLNGVSSLGIGKDSCYDIFNNNDSFYRSSRQNNEFFFGKIIIVKIDDEIKYEDKSNNPSFFSYLETLKTYNLKHSIDINQLNKIEEFILENENNLKDLFNPKFVQTKEFEHKFFKYKDSIIRIINEYKEIVNQKDFEKLTNFDIKNKIENIKPIECNDFYFKNFTFSGLCREFENFLTNQNENNIFNRIQNKINENNITLDR